MPANTLNSSIAAEPVKSRSLREHAAKIILCPSDILFAFGVSSLWLVFYNVRFWQDTAHAMWHATGSSLLFLVSLATLVLCVQALLLLLFPTRRLMLGAASVLFLIAAVGSYFSTKYGVVMNKDMLRNVFETNAAESRSLLSAELSARFVFMGVIPALLVWRVRFPPMQWARRLRTRILAMLGIVILCAAALLTSSASYAVFFREHKPIRFALSPAAPVASALGLLLDERHSKPGPLINASGHAERIAPPNARPLLVVVVVGEAARADNFQLGGYARPTNPELASITDLVYFSRTTSCATATAVSVPCMFSHLGRSSFDVNAASRYANLLDALQDAGFDVEWRDNDAGCKGVCARVRQINYPESRGSRLCRGAYCYDEVLIQDLAGKLRDLQHDSVMVMHQIGSHGPAYAQRYPPEREAFRPACRSNQLQRCSTQEVVNAYDNTIAYTDRVLARTIRLLRTAADHVDSVLLYASDHGESLGEHGLYLHGLPYNFAPSTQTHIPMLMWFSSGYLARSGVALKCVQSRAGEALTHDNLYHTVLGAAEVRNSSYDAALDILDACRGARWPHDHE